MASAHGTELSEVPDPEQQPLSSLLQDCWAGEGKPSVIQAYCQRAIDQGNTECGWVCMRRGNRTIAKDIQLNNCGFQPDLRGLRKQCGWWKRHSLFSAVGCKEVQDSLPRLQ
ncbi:hypothetical protein GJ744_009057 [Endocarpon pusillum]|uniref:Uncharacterized protein n=1 Tax=Endocarpon pusillum TaxID=364733 RepID=A0A8H7AGE1_9EURO|nr:hypothetical protein GJ744_009057 [Endocarpon pusillum]